MARHKPELSFHARALRGSLAAKVGELERLFARGYRPQTLHLHAADYVAIVDDLSGAGFDVARGIVFKGIPVRPFNAR